MRAAVFPASRVYYSNVLPAVKALRRYSDVERVILTIEDDAFPGELPDWVKTVNVSGQRYFLRGSPNMRNQYVYLCLLRVVYADLFPELDMVVALDADAIAVKPFGSALWDLDMDGLYMAGVPEPKLSAQRRYPYINMGMAVFNLAEMRKDGLPERMQEALNTKWYQWVEQDCLNEFCKGKTLVLGSEWNCSQFSEPCPDPFIRHFAYDRTWTQSEPFLRFASAEWGAL